MIGVYAYRDNDPGSSFGVTSLMACGLAAWAVGAVLVGEPDAQSDMATTALGGRGARAGLEVILVLAAAAVLTVVFLAYPLGLVAVRVGNEFDPAVRAGDVVAAALGHLSCAALGGAVGVLFAPPRLTRRATAIAAVIAALLAFVAVSAALGPVGGPVAFAQAETDAPAGAVTGAVSSPARAASSSPARSSPARPGGPPAAATPIGKDRPHVRHRTPPDLRPPVRRVEPRRRAQGRRRAPRRDAAGLTGRVVEVGAGNGLNFGHYPATVTEVVAVEPEPYLRERAEEAARAAPVDVTVVVGLADALPAEDGAFDAAVASLVLCSVPDQAGALAELRRVVRPDGELRFYEHVSLPAGAARCSAGSTTGGSGRG